MPVIPANLAPPPMPVIPANLALPPMPIIQKDLAPPPMPIIPNNLAPPPMPVIPANLALPPMPVIQANLAPPPMPVIWDDVALPSMAAHVSYTFDPMGGYPDSPPTQSNIEFEDMIDQTAYFNPPFLYNYTEQQLWATYDQIINSSVGDNSYDGKVTTFKNLRLHQLQSEILTYNALEEIDAGLAGIESSLEKHLYTGRDE